MIDVKMALRNIFRHPRRTALTVLAIAFASLLLVFMLSFQFGGYEAMINTSVKVSTGHLQVQAVGYQNDSHIWQAIDVTPSLEKILDGQSGILNWSFRCNAFCLVSSGKRTDGVLVTGIDPDREKEVSSIASLVRKGTYLEGKDVYKALVGTRLARNLGLNPGDELTLLGQGRDGSVAASVLTVQGIFESGIDAVDRSTLMIPLNDFQDIFFMNGGVHQAVIMVSSLKRVASVKEALSGKLMPEKSLAVLDWMEIMPGLLQSIQMDLVSGLIMYLILVIVVAFSILNTFLMAVFERTKEFGVMMAIGTSPSRIMRLVMMESAAMTLLGIILGMVSGAAITLYFQHQGIYIPGTEEMFKQYGIPNRLYPRLSLLTLFAGPLVVFVITFISSVFPALKIRFMNPLEAMNHV